MRSCGPCRPPWPHPGRRCPSEPTGNCRPYCTGPLRRPRRTWAANGACWRRRPTRHGTPWRGPRSR
eukprot:15459926-Alexandrium_andersonii.AAC.1